MFQIGDYVVYGNNGVCVVGDITGLDFSGVDHDKKYYCLIPQCNKGGKIYAAVGQEKVIMRRLLTENEAKTLIDSVEDIKPMEFANEKLCEPKYKEALQTCDCKEWFRIIRTMHFRKLERLASGRKITALDERYLKAAEDNLYGELSVVLNVDRKEVEQFITDRVEAAQPV